MTLDAELWPEPVRTLSYGRGLMALAVGVFGGPCAWFADQQVAYWLVYHACHTQSLAWLYVETAIAVAIGGASTFVAWRTLGWFPHAGLTAADPADRTRFLSWVGIGLSGLSTLVILAAALPRVVLHPCP